MYFYLDIYIYIYGVSGVWLLHRLLCIIQYISCSTENGRCLSSKLKQTQDCNNILDPTDHYQILQDSAHLEGLQGYLLYRGQDFWNPRKTHLSTLTCNKTVINNCAYNTVADRIYKYISMCEFLIKGFLYRDPKLLKLTMHICIATLIHCLPNNPTDLTPLWGLSSPTPCPLFGVSCVAAHCCRWNHTWLWPSHPSHNHLSGRKLACLESSSTWRWVSWDLIWQPP